MKVARSGIIGYYSLMTKENAILKDLANAVKNKRKELGLTQEKLSGISGVGIRFIVELEGGNKETLQIGKVQHVLKRLGLSLYVNERNIK